VTDVRAGRVEGRGRGRAWTLLTTGIMLALALPAVRRRGGTCPDCGAVQELPAGRAACFRCGALLASVGSNRALALPLALAAVPLFFGAQAFPLLRLEGAGGAETTVFGAVLALQRQQPALAALVLVTAVLVPLGRLAVLCAAAAAPTARLLRLEALARPWAQLEILLLGLVVAFGKLAGVFPMAPGPGVGCLLALLVVEGAAHRCLPPPPPRLASPSSLRRTTAFLLAAALLFVPANLLPVMTTRTLLRAHGDTIASGVVALWRAGSPALAVLVFAASIVVPALKILSLSLLVVTASADG